MVRLSGLLGISIQEVKGKECINSSSRRPAAKRLVKKGVVLRDPTRVNKDSLSPSQQTSAPKRSIGSASRLPKAAKQTAGLPCNFLL